MTKSCAVFGCHSRSGKPGCEGVAFYRLPMRDNKLLRIWLKRLRTESLRVNKNTRICSLHFEGGRKSGPNDIPSIFPWTNSRSRRPLRKRSTSAEKDDDDDSSHHENDDPDDHERSSDSSMSAATKSGSDLPSSEYYGFSRDLVAERVSAAGGSVPPCVPELSTKSVSAADDSGSNCEHSRAQSSGPPTLAVPMTSSPRLDVKCTQCEHWSANINVVKSQLLNVVDDLTKKLEAMRVERDAAVILSKQLQSSLSTSTPADKECSTSTERPSFSIDTISHSDELVRFYTGLPGMAMFEALFELVEDCVPGMVMWSGSRSLDVMPSSSKKTPHILSPKNELLLTLMKLRLDPPYLDLSMRFHVSVATVSRVVTTWLLLLHKKFKSLDISPSKEQVMKDMPTQFKELYPSTRVIIDCTEFPIEKPSDPDSQRCTWSTYKNRNIFKLLVGITPSGAISFLSSLYGGSVSDNEITLSSGILDLLEEGDSLMADKGFHLQKDCEARNITLNIPPVLGKDSQLSPADLTETRRIASLRVHVERVVERVKNFHILHSIGSQWYTMADVLVHVCGMLTNFQEPAVS